MENFVKISDTDSLYIELFHVLNHIRDEGIEINDKTNFILQISKKLEEEINNNLDVIIPNLLNVKRDKHYIKFKQEIIAETILTTGKRRYAMYITNKEGVEVEELDMKGLELMKSNMNKRFKKFGEQFIKDILFKKSKSEIDQSIIDFHKYLKTLSPREIAKPTGVKQISSYRIIPTSGEIFGSFKIKAPSNTKAACRYNDLLKFKKLDKQYESIIEGDKIFIINLKKNPYGIETMALPNSKTPKEIEDFVQEYIDIDEIFESMLLKKLKSLYEDLKWSFPSLNPNVNKFFTF